MDARKAVTNALIATLALASGGCEYFSTTTIPASDPYDPWASVAVYFDGDHEYIRVGDQDLATAYNSEAFHHTTDDPFDYFFALAAGVDGSGVAEVEMTSQVYVRCIYGAPNQTVLDPWTTETVTQSGSPGDTVDNGLYVARFFRGLDYLDGLDTCSDGNYRITLAWYSRTRDFGGNEAYYGTARISYFHFGS